MMKKNEKAAGAKQLYQLCCEDEFSNEIIVCCTYRHKCSAYRAKERLDKKSSVCTFWVQPITVAEYNMQLVRECIKNSHQKEIEVDCHKLIETNILSIDTKNLTVALNNDVLKNIKLRLMFGQKEVRHELIEVQDSSLLDSIFFTAKHAPKHGKYEFAVGIKRKEHEYAEGPMSVIVNISHIDTFLDLRRNIGNEKFMKRILDSLKEAVTKSIYMSKRF